MINNLSQTTDDISKNHSDIMQMGTGIGNSNPINKEGNSILKPPTNQYKDYLPKAKEEQKPNQNIETPKAEENITESDLDKWARENEHFKNQIDDLRSKRNSSIKWTPKLNNQLNEILGENKAWLGQANFQERIDKAIQKLEGNISKNDKLTNDFKSKDDYDGRTEEQKREDEKQEKLEGRQDNAYQRAVEDMRKAGLNPGLMYGSGGAAQSGSASTSNQEGKSKRRKREDEERKRNAAARNREENRLMSQIMTMLGMAVIKKM